MLRNSERWCPKGCGKTLHYCEGWPEKFYPCVRCEGQWTKEELRKYWGKEERQDSKGVK